jgi:hypothetical protein
MNNISKELHLYWNGSKMSQLQTFTADSFHKLNPDWNINLYVPKQGYYGSVKYIPDYSGPDYFPLLLKKDFINFQEIDLDDYDISHGHHDILRSDIFRYHKLYEMGGVWSDFDVVWLKPMSHFNKDHYVGNVEPDAVTAVVSFIQDTHGGHSIGIMIHCKNDPYVLSLIKATKDVKPPFGHELFGGSMLNKLYPTMNDLSNFEGLVGAKFSTYYPYNIHPVQIDNTISINNLYMTTDLSCINDNVMCLHWYNGHRLSKHYLNTDGFNRSCSMTEILKREGYI